MIDFKKSMAQLTGRRVSSQVIEIHLPDFNKEDIKRVLSCFYTGQMLIENEVQSLALKNLWKTLGIDSIQLSDLDFLDLDEIPSVPKTPSIQKNEERPPKSTPLKKNTQIKLINPAATSKTPQKTQKVTSVSKQKTPAKTVQKNKSTPQKSSKSPPLKAKPRGRPSKDSQEDIVVLDEDEPPAKKRPTSPLPKPVSIKSPQKSNASKKFLTIKCEKCQQILTFHGRDFKGNAIKYQMHVISCYQDHLFSDVPYLENYFCPGKDEKCKGEMKTRISFLFHLALNHMEFHPRIMRLLQDPERFKHAPLVPFVELKNIITTFKDYPTLKCDFTELQNEDITGEVNIYEAFESRSRLTRKYACVPCGKSFKNMDYAVLHQFISHGVKFLNEPTMPNVNSYLLSCPGSDFVTYSKSDYIARLGHFHGRFQEIKGTLSKNIKGQIAWPSLFNLTQGSGYMQQHNSSPFHVIQFQYDHLSRKLYSNCKNCQLDLWSFMDLKRHMGQNHKNVPVNFDCQDCGKRFFYQALPTEDKLKIHRCNENGKVNQPLEPAHTVYLPIEDSEKNGEVAPEYDDDEEELIEID